MKYQGGEKNGVWRLASPIILLQSIGEQMQGPGRVDWRDNLVCEDHGLQCI